MRPEANALLITTMLAVIGCNTNTTTTPNESLTPNNATVVASPPSLGPNDPAQYTFHRNVAFTDVTKDLPSGSVDHLDLNMAADPNVIVVVTVTAEHKEGLRFTTTFTGPKDLKITKDWQPASGGERKNTHVALFVLPDAVTAGNTVVH
jgi:hypothetical protein